MNGLAAAHGLDLSRVTARRSSPRTHCAASTGCGTSSTSTTTCASRRLLFDGVLEPVDGDARPGPFAGRSRARAEARRGAAVGGVKLARQPPRRPHAAAPGRADRGLGAGARARGLPRALQGLVRRQVDVDAARADPAAHRGRRCGRLLREGGAHRAAGRLGALRARRPRRDRHARAGRAQAARRLQGGALQPRDGAAAARARARSASSARSASPPRSSSASDERRGAGAPEPARASAARGDDTADGRPLSPTTTCSARSRTGTRSRVASSSTGCERVPPIRFFDAGGGRAR